MKAGLIIVGIWSALLLLLSLTATGAFGFLYEGSYYTFTLPFIVATALVLSLAVSGLVATRIRSSMFWFVTPLFGLLYFPYQYAVAQWPGGDDGPGMFWLLFVGRGSQIAGILAIVIIVTGIVIRIRKPVVRPRNTRQTCGPTRNSNTRK
jgi:hypothetical protein